MKKGIKKILTVSLLSLMALTACGGNENNSTASDSHATSEKDSNTGAYGLPTNIPILQEDSVQIHYNRKSGDYKNWNLWLWCSGLDGSAYEFNYEDDFGLVASYPLSLFGSSVINDSLGFIVRKGEWQEKDTESDRFIAFNELKKDANGVYHVYLYQGDANVYTDANKTVVYKIKTARFSDENTIFISGNSEMTGYTLYKDGNSIKTGTINEKDFANIYLDEKCEFGSSYTIEITFKGGITPLTSSISMNALFSTQAFKDKYNYDGELGALYSETETIFRVWSPIASKIILKLYANGTPSSVSTSLGSDVVYKEVEMTAGEKGTFETKIEENLDGYYYTYTVFSNYTPNGKEIVDPYAKACGVNGLRGMIVDFSKTNPEGWDTVEAKPYDRKELAVYETHVVDITSSSTWGGTSSLSKTYKGMVEEGTRLPTDSSIKTGFDHIVELGVNAVQLQPIFDHANDEVNKSFNWGYNPLNYNCLEGSYSSNPHDGKVRIKEFKELVQAFNKKGINIIMDVVYNHVNGAVGSNFDVLMPGYYYRYNGSGELTNGSGCGNETASENYMMRKFMIDSTRFWASEYKLGGFRFDLMGLHDVETMNQLTAACKELNPNICIYGEPWTGGTSGYNGITGSQMYTNKFVGFGEFNDQMRDALIKGGLSGPKEKGWITSTDAPKSNDVSKILSGMKGMIQTGSDRFTDPDKTVNYVTCHDNYTLADRINAAGITDSDTVAKMNVLANSIVFTSQGTSFMLAGDEMLRTKGENSNSYNASYEVNELDYSKLATPQGKAVFDNYCALVRFKTNTEALHYSENEIATKTASRGLEEDSILRYTLEDENNEYVIYHANGYVPSTGRSSIDLTGYTIYLDTLNQVKTGGKITLGQYQTIIAYKTK